MHIDNFILEYGTSQKRIYLINLLKKELQAIDDKGWACKVYVFGSLVNSDVTEPNDIDCLFSVSNKLYSGEWVPIATTKEMHTWPSYIPFKSSCFYSTCRSLHEMVNAFNDCNQKTGEKIVIEPSNCVEVTI